MPASLENPRCAFQPLVNLNTGGVVAIEVLVHPTPDDQPAERSPELDIELAVFAARASAEHETLLPLHLNLLARTVATYPAGVERLHHVLCELGRRPHELVIEVGGQLRETDYGELLDELRRLRAAGYRVAWDGGDVSLSLLLAAEVDIVKLDPRTIAGLPDQQRGLAFVEAMALFCRRTRTTLAATGVHTAAQLKALRGNRIQLVQGDLVAPAARRPTTRVSLAAEVSDVAELPIAAGPVVTEFLHPATMLSVEATADEVRSVLVNRPEVTSVVLVDENRSPQWSIDRNRFLLAVTGPYGHALHAKRHASRLADHPVLVATNSTAMDALHLSMSGSERRYDDIVVVDNSLRCMGIVRLSDLFRGLAEMKVEEAAALSPLTRLPGSDAVAREVDRRIVAGQIFAMCWLDVDGFKFVNDAAGFAAGDDLIRLVGRRLADSAAALRSAYVGHVGGDDFLAVVDVDDLVGFARAMLDGHYQVEGRAVTVSLATLVCAGGTVPGYREVSRLLAPLKRQAKALTGSSWVLGRPGSDRVDVLRGTVAQPRRSSASAPTGR
ncbi:GGDEF domain-containing protein [Allokutzneria sp. A3M-2-11 16]|uniref:EAL domain-containing protein n=1 Tax=Allokutzneria sp. A3M-2-11 16 TaxID=2962043 RepID=UPI0020B79315|nr:EAL domain-containing protein [Allokutzneria sp. A3M-2-11 16]MCP3803596.1 GGDEF domain-containing protein [Allokutzneria sp. A3M-2-11 16]